MMGVSPLALVRSIRDTLFLRDASYIDSALTSASVTTGVSKQHYSYLVFGFFSLAYFWYYLPQGFTILDDAYLLALGQRLFEGQQLYRDFYYLRTPLSPLIQSVWIGLLGDNYTILLSRIIWALQLCATIVIFSLLYRRWLSAISLALVLCATLVYSSLLFAFPWYSYDGMFFTALFALFAYRRRMLLAGVFAGLAFLSKQGFIVILPLYVLLDLLETKLAKEPIRNWFARSVQVGGGLVAVVVLAGLILPASLTEIWNNVFVLPKRINALPLSFLLYQDLPETFLTVWPLALSLLIVLLAPFRATVKATALLIWVIAAWSHLGATAAILPQVLTLVTFAALSWFYLLGLWETRERVRDTHRNHRNEIFKVSGLALIVLYAAGFNYNGWVFSYIGAALSLPMLVLWSSFWSDGRVKANEDGKAGGLGRWVSPALAIVFLAPSLAVHHKFPYKSLAREELTVPFATPQLSGIYADSTTVAEIDGLVESVLTNSKPEESILAFPNPASLNFLTGRSAWGAIQWYYEREFDSAMAAASVQLLYESPPALVVLNDPQYIPETPQFDVLYHAIYDNFLPVDTVGPFHILIPLCREAGD